MPIDSMLIDNRPAQSYVRVDGEWMTSLMPEWEAREELGARNVRPVESREVAA